MNDIDTYSALVNTISAINPTLLHTNGVSNSNLTSAITTMPATQWKQVTAESVMEKYEMNRVAVDYKVTEQELMKLKETAPDYASEIKEKIAREVARDVIKKVSFTKKKVEDTNHFIGRVWVFSDEELKQILEGMVDV